MATSRLLSSIVSEISIELNDPSQVKYGTRAKAVFLRMIRLIMENPIRYRMRTSDYRGLIIEEEKIIASGTILFSEFANTVNEIISIRTDSDSATDQLPFELIKINSGYPNFEDYSAKNHFYTPKVDSSYQAGWYINNGIEIKFYPVDIGDDYYVTTKYLSELDTDEFELTTEMYIGGTSGKFSNKFIDTAIDLTVNKIRSERNK